jgi:hypothetical protein
MGDEFSVSVLSPNVKQGIDLNKCSEKVLTSLFLCLIAVYFLSKISSRHFS